MAKLLIDNHSTFYDIQTEVQFSPVLDRTTGCFVGVADVDPVTAAKYAGREHFRLLDDAEFLAMTELKREPVAEEPQTGDPLTDAAGEEPPPTPGKAKKAVA